ncbi:MAG TPA: DUF2501 domain-containing protein [Sphingomonas sp.]
MRTSLIKAALIAGAIAASAPLAAQLGGLSALGKGSGGGSGLLGGMLPDVGGSSMNNAAGVLSYCVKNKILGGDGATSALGALTGRKAVTSSKGFAAGESGNLLTGQGGGVSLDSVKGKVKSKVCDMVLQHARSFL